MCQEYKLETSVDGIKWTLQASFLEGEQSRYGIPFNENVMLREARDYVEFWKNRRNPANFKYCRIIIDIKV